MFLSFEFVGCQRGDERDRVKGSFVVVVTLNCFTFGLIKDQNLYLPFHVLERRDFQAELFIIKERNK